MAKGKYATRRENQRVRLESKVVDALTEANKEAKAALAAAEQRAAQLERVERMIPQVSAKNDVLLAEARGALTTYRRLAKADARRKQKGMDDLLKMAGTMPGLRGKKPGDIVAFLEGTYPALIDALTNAGGEMVEQPRTRRKLSDESRERLDRMEGWIGDGVDAEAWGGLIGDVTSAYTPDPLLVLPKNTEG